MNADAENQNIPIGIHSFTCGGYPFIVDLKYEFVNVIGLNKCSVWNNRTQTKMTIQKEVNTFDDLIYGRRLVKEIMLLSTNIRIYNEEFFQHQNINSLLDIEKPLSQSEFKDIYIVTEFMDTDLYRVIYSKQELTDEHVQYFVYQILRGLLYVHSANVIHRDLKPRNILINKNCDLKISNFGSAIEIDKGQDSKAEFIVAHWYSAPEEILNQSLASKAVDIYSVGCIFAELLGKAPLFPGQDQLDQVQKIIAVLGTPTIKDMQFIVNDNAIEFIKSLPKNSKQNWETLYPQANNKALDLLSKMITFNPQQRYSVEQCLSHPYFAELHNPDEEPICAKGFNWSSVNFEPTKELLQNIIYQESVSFDDSNLDSGNKIQSN